MFLCKSQPLFPRYSPLILLEYISHHKNEKYQLHEMCIISHDMTKGKMKLVSVIRYIDYQLIQNKLDIIYTLRGLKFYSHECNCVYPQ